MYKGFARWFYGSIEEFAELFVHEISCCDFMIRDIVFDHSEENDTYSAFIFESSVLRGLKVRVCAAPLEAAHEYSHFVEILLPIGGVSHIHKRGERLLAVDLLSGEGI